MAKTKEESDLIPRVSVLEMSQQAIQRDLSNLTHSVQKQGEQLTLAITQLSHAQNTNYTALSEKIGAANQTDWQSFWSMIAVVLVLVSLILAPFYIMNANTQEKITEVKERISLIEKELLFEHHVKP
jgi:di/tricarboxylate transporter